MTHTSRPRFTKVRMREGYDVDEVESFLAEVDRELLGPLPNARLAERITGVRFAPVRLREGYDMGEVDQHLDALERQALGGGNRPSHAPAPRSGSTVAPSFFFRTTRFRDGYSVTEVDAFIAQVMQGLAGRLPNESLARYILGARFSPVSMPQRGYRMEDVDQQLDKLRQWALTGIRPS